MASWRLVLRHYERGIICQAEMLFQLMQDITEDNASEFLTSVPRELLPGLKSYIRSWPNTDGGWSKGKLYPLMGARTKDIKAGAAWLVRHRRGVEVLRDAIARATISPSLLSWSGGTLPRIARAIREERAFDQIPILGDALEDAGAGHKLVAHCRSWRPHFRCCWVLRGLLNEA